MSSTTRIIVQREHEVPDDWRRFVAILCFIYFYSQFVSSVSAFWGTGLVGDRPVLFDYEFWNNLAGAFSAIVMYLCGRSLWYKGRFMFWWLVGAIISLIVATWLDFFSERYGSWFWMKFSTWQFMQMNLWKSGALAILWMLPWVAVLIAAVLCNRPSAFINRWRYKTWVIVAVVWCICQTFHMAANSDLANLISERLENTGLVFIAIPIAAMCPILTAIFLLKGSHLARLMALIVVAIKITICCFDSWVLSRLVWIACKALLLSSPHQAVWNYSPFPFGIYLMNRQFFNTVFIEFVLDVGPWILIALYAWRVPMRKPEDDGSPYPRRYCGNCYYNLYGLDSLRCPECGVELIGNGC